LFRVGSRAWTARPDAESLGIAETFRGVTVSVLSKDTGDPPRAWATLILWLSGARARRPAGVDRSSFRRTHLPRPAGRLPPDGPRLAARTGCWVGTMSLT